jgi:lysine-N-methylase
MVQRELGEDALSDTCYVYPRHVMKFGDRIEQSLTLSCPEAARLALTESDAFEFVVAEFTSRLATTPVIGALRGFSIDEMDEVRFFCVQIFQTASLSNTERLAALGWLCQQLDKLVSSDSQAQVTSLLAEMTELIANGNLHPIVAQLNEQQDASVTLFATLFGSKAPKCPTIAQQETLDQIKKGLAIDATLDWEKITANYIKGGKLLAEVAEVYDKLMGRYLLNDMVRETFPWSLATAMEHYRRLLTRYGILRLMLAGRAAGQGAALSETEMVQTIQIFCRFYQHNATFAALAESLLAASDWTQLDRLYALLN